MLRFKKGALPGALILALGLGCAGEDTAKKPAPKGGGGGDMMGQKMKEMAGKHGGGAHADKDKDKDKDKDEDKDKQDEDKDKQKEKDQAKDKE